MTQGKIIIFPCSLCFRESIKSKVCEDLRDHLKQTLRLKISYLRQNIKDKSRIKKIAYYYNGLTIFRTRLTQDNQRSENLALQ